MKPTEHYKILQKASGFQIYLLIRWTFQRMLTENVENFYWFKLKLDINFSVPFHASNFPLPFVPHYK